MKFFKRLFAAKPAPETPVAPVQDPVNEQFEERWKRAASQMNDTLVYQAQEHAKKIKIYRDIIASIILKVGPLSLSDDLMRSSESVSFQTTQDTDGTVTLKLSEG